jgi:(4S)-4-hydroxy-5-phosphonooxypentane-2,3-dione isomerase
MPQVGLVARFKAKPGKAEELIAGAFRPLLEQVEKEPGTLLYLLHRSTDDPDLFWFYELYADDEAVDAHRGSATMAAVMPLFGELVAESEFTFGAPVFGKGLPA